MQPARSIRLARVLGAALALLSAAACADQSTTSPTAIARVPGPRFNVEGDAGAAAAGAPLVSATGAGCLTVTGAFTPATVGTCVSGAASQTWTTPAAGTSGTVTASPVGVAVCLTGYNNGAAGQPAGSYGCVNWGTQQWTLTTASELKIGASGACATAVGASVVLRNCDGSAAQQWTTSAPATTAPATPTTAPAAGQLASATGAGCLTVGGAFTAATVGSCVSGAASQTWTTPAIGATGTVTASPSGSAVCLTGYNNGAAGQAVGSYGCVNWGTQQWTMTSAGELKIGSAGPCATVVGTAVVLRNCDGSASQQWTGGTTATPGTPSTPPASTTPAAGQLASAAGAGCLTVSGAFNAATVGTCVSGATSQTWTTPAIGATGTVTASPSGSAVCLTGFNNGGAGQPVGSYGCVNWGTQQWTLTTAGELKLNAIGTCATVSGSTVVLRACDGSASQKWTTSAVTTAPVTETPSVPVSATPTPSGAGAVTALMGAAPSVATVQAQGGIWKRYEDEFAPNADRHWAAAGADWYEGNYYDRAMIYYVWWARTGNATYLERANAMAVTYRDGYLVPNNYGPSAYWAQMDGVALHYAVTGDERSRLAVGRVGDGFASPSSLLYIGSTGMEQRDQARTLVGLLLAWKIQAPSAMGYDWASMLRTVLTKVLATQSADGAYRVEGSQCGYNKPFMVGMLNDALIRYYEMFEQDPRILSAVKRSADYMWQNDWLAAQQSFVYLGGTCNSSFGSGDRSPAPDLNNMISSAYGWLGRKTGDASYFTKGDAIFAGGVNGAYLTGSKQFNQEYTSSYRYLAYRF